MISIAVITTTNINGVTVTLTNTVTSTGTATTNTATTNTATTNTATTNTATTNTATTNTATTNTATTNTATTGTGTATTGTATTGTGTGTATTGTTTGGAADGEVEGTDTATTGRTTTKLSQGTDTSSVNPTFTYSDATTTYITSSAWTSIWVTVTYSNGGVATVQTTYSQRFKSFYSSVDQPSSGTIGLGSISGSVGVVKSKHLVTQSTNAGIINTISSGLIFVVALLFL
ncbi:hypothetical protein WICANDRAFT_61491 [Wickerhamomyces anomalus NRRL Y-366-8]|uniref:Uncharacterized protein n=1 Tax=Wickerhamomyces anomalus (strain ATCC 58044 / CBS 1984 / NCYC 433 / NRRL Y-366-8) TaxID=683960 RepID=A0A1E3P6G6_WICAA|nr:uncharacterized protein WICANDRAFT_61491 [Wickerhamomyces anomalus NRRL Y-366-8]ODQ60933.1 hypothetical protein WICANDRAFT_61491 [Wickerhamomyces anomalus NRRL Y-366-8]